MDPPSHSNRRNFFAELQSQKPSDNKPWMVLGDFNQTLNATDRSNVARGPDRTFVSLITTLELIDLPLTGRQYTWARGTDNPSFVRLDRILISNAWSSTFPNTSQKALYSPISDHCPLQCTIKTKFPLPNTFRFENFLLKIPDFKNLVTNTWTGLGLPFNPSKLSTKLQALRTKIRQWAKEKVGDLNSQTDASNQALMWIVRAEETRQLTRLEILLREILTDRLAQIDKLKEIKWRQRAKRQWIKEGDKNTKYFHAVASHHKRANLITSILSEQTEVSEHSSKARIFFHYFCNLIGKEERADINFDLQNFYSQHTIS